MKLQCEAVSAAYKGVDSWLGGQFGMLEATCDWLSGFYMSMLYICVWGGLALGAATQPLSSAS